MVEQRLEALVQRLEAAVARQEALAAQGIPAQGGSGGAGGSGSCKLAREYAAVVGPILKPLKEKIGAQGSDKVREMLTNFY